MNHERKDYYIVKHASQVILFVFVAIATAWGNSFEPPAGSLDPSWREALVQATDQNLRFGTDIVFTFGPYHQLFTNAISENIYPLVVGRWIYGIAWGYAAIGLASISSHALGWLIALFIALSGTISTDSGFYALQLSFLLIAARQNNLSNWRMLLFIYFGVVISIFCKLSYAISGVPIVLCAALLLVRNPFSSFKRSLAVLCPLTTVPAITWIISGQALPNLISYLFGKNILVISGYSSAMSAFDASANWQIPVFWSGSILLTYLIAKFSLAKPKGELRAVVIASASFFLFWVSFKAGMVRHDAHGVVSGQSLSWFSLITLAYAGNRFLNINNVLPALFSFTFGLSITSQYISPIRTRLDLWIAEKGDNTYLFLKTIASSRAKQRLQLMRDEGFRRIRPAIESFHLIPPGSTTDSLPWDITEIPANSLIYRPRPVIQSYSAYNPILQNLNKDHFKGRNAPSYLIFRASSIDGRNHSDLDYPSIEIIASRYKIVGTGDKGSLILKRQALASRIKDLRWQRSADISISSELTSIDPTKNRWIVLPSSIRPGTMFSLDIKPTFWRRLSSIAFKPRPLFLEIRFSDGSVKSFRVFESSTRMVPLYPMVLDNKTLEAYIRSLQEKLNKNIKGSTSPLPIAIRLAGSLKELGIKKANVYIDEPRF